MSCVFGGRSLGGCLLSRVVSLVMSLRAVLPGFLEDVFGRCLWECVCGGWLFGELSLRKIKPEVYNRQDNAPVAKTCPKPPQRHQPRRHPERKSEGIPTSGQTSTKDIPGKKPFEHMLGKSKHIPKSILDTSPAEAQILEDVLVGGGFLWGFRLCGLLGLGRCVLGCRSGGGGG